jgi:hypothetical protein
MAKPGMSLRGSTHGFGFIQRCVATVLGIAFFTAPVFAQQTGDISGRVIDESGAAVSGVVIEASSNVLPQERTTTSAGNGRYRLPLLPPGNYELTFTFSDGSSTVRGAEVLLQQSTEVNVRSGAAAAGMEEIVVTGAQTLADTGQASLSDAIDSVTIEALPVGQEYRDLMKLIPGVQYSQDLIRGPSAGGSGQDNMYLFDGVDVSLPLFGNLSAEPSSHDIAQVSIVRGGAKAIGFNRSGGFLINTVSKTGTNEFSGEVSYQAQTADMTGDLDHGDSLEAFDEDKDWLTMSLGGPILRDRLFFYGSYYRPTVTRGNSANAYGPVGDYESTRDEFFGKLTFAPTSNLLFDASYRTSDREVVNRGTEEFGAASTSEGDEATLDIAILEGSWIVNDVSSFSFKYTNFENKTSSRPDTMFNFPIAVGDSIDIANLDQQGLLEVPTPLPGEDAFNAFIQPVIEQYGFIENGVAMGGGTVGGASTITNNDFAREGFELAYDRTIYAGNVTHDLHIGYQYQTVEEVLARTSNGWGLITVPGGRTTATDGVTPVYYIARFGQMGLQTSNGAAVDPITSSVDMQSFEINDTIEIGDWTYNIGVLVSNDVMYGQGLRPNPDNPVTGMEQAPGNKYKMYEVDWEDLIQPRLGVSWAYNDTSTVYVNYAKYNPSASSQARAASWDRNLAADIEAMFDENGNFIEVQDVTSSSGKAFDDDLTPRSIDEYLVGWTKDFSGELTLHAHARYRKGAHFWEDTNNNARVDFQPPPGIPQELYVPNLDDIRAEIGGSSYVVAELDGGFTKYYEASLEAEWNRDRWFLNASYVWSHYYGNFDQDNTTTTNDANVFIGSSFIADDAGRQLWNMREGNLRGDRRHLLKLYGFYEFNWEGRAGAYLVYQSGQPWEAWDSNVYRHLTSSISDTSRFAEPAGSRTSPSHWQLDLNYTHNFAVFNDYNLQLRADLFNVFDRQTGYNYDPFVNGPSFGEPRDWYNPRRLQLAVKFQF